MGSEVHREGEFLLIIDKVLLTRNSSEVIPSASL
jgi:hypothetical protein